MNRWEIMGDALEEDWRGDFSMFTAKGNRVVAKACKHIATWIGSFSADRNEAIELIQNEMMRMAESHREIFDTEPHWAICHATAAAFRMRGWKPYNRFNDIPPEVRHMREAQDLDEKMRGRMNMRNDHA
jgi:hypothetical protein